MNFDLSKLAVIVVILIFAGLLWFQDQSFQDGTHGVARVIDGDSLEINAEQIRLKGIDAPEGQQKCQKNGKDWSCGLSATSALRRMIGSGAVSCRGEGYDRFDRLLAYCKAGETDLNKSMIIEGWALSFGGDYRSEERMASKQKKGIWAGEFERPQDWRRKNPRY